MKRVLVIDNNFRFTADIDSFLVIEEVDDIDIQAVGDVSKMNQEMQSYKPDEIVITATLAAELPDGISLPVRSYARDEKGIGISESCGIPCFGIINDAADLINAIRDDSVMPARQQTKKQKQQEETYIPDSGDEPQPDETPDTGGPFQNAKPAEGQPAQQQSTAPAAQQQAPAAAGDDATQQLLMALAQTLLAQNGNAVALQNNAQQPEANNPVPQIEEEPAQPQKNEPQKPSMEEPQDDSGESDIKARIEATKQKKEAEARKATEDKAASIKEEAAPLVERDLGNTKDPAKLITVYSAKGGVGKTTIACELATVMALTAHGRDHFQVCLVDMDLLYPSITNTLNFDVHGVTVNSWVEDIKRKKAQYGSWDGINYSEDEIRRFLQKKEDTGVYALLAPLSPESYAEIPEQEMQFLIPIIIENLTKNGGFDYVIVDTGNNLNNETHMVLSMSDEILLLLTQSMNNANANDMFLRTMQYVDFDFDRIKLVINCVRPAKTVGIQVSELETALLNPVTGKPFECYCRIKDYEDVRSAENLGEPVVLQSSHDFTKSINELKAKVIGDQSTLTEPPKKKGFFSRFRKKD